ncbi:Nucleoside 2-deoxyribosyltransferase [Isobaculum melis]|uniref:Nucleoside 2-deoxyribosyltransferase n=2 Tax=Isobaculum melis TaxID=142588 RepID=A0A1H9TCA6_9LACT|nr:Nucleoside 2-deoxyribosyltransferase [Isobaculum melis]
MKKIYFASPLFSDMERLYNEMVVAKIRETYPEFDLFVPQEQMGINDKNAYADAKTIAKYDTDALLNSQLVIAVLDGTSIDVGVATEIGVAYQAGIPIVGLYTDSRQQGATNQKKLDALQELAESQFSYINLYTVGLIKMNGIIVDNLEDLIQEIA